ncbi:MinD/ParA family ATP-binding protein [Thermophilibacter mediterraneus]|uniref:MinD/ParA family ATP-binding protein n=1 Tax=Thermophilibacter mediterraneus TaxID=1871031 RepID=UPI0023529334|nr:P-loop NTPase [Thermophilibacter mediterraneus]
MSEWVVLCDERELTSVERAIRTIDPAPDVEAVGTADALRRAVLEAAPGALGAVAGPVRGGVTDVNLAAAVARDGNARCVALAARGVSGSLRSRAARAGVDHVLDLDDLGGGPDVGAPRGDGGRLGGASRSVPPPPPRRADALAAPGMPASEPTGDVAGRAPVIVVCSGRGGVGKTAVAAVAAARAAGWGMRVCALDLDLSCGNLYSCFGLPRGSDLARLADAPAVTPELLGHLCVPVTAELDVVGPCERPESSELAMAGTGELVRMLALERDLVVVDTSTTFTDAVAQVAQLADRLLVVSDGGPATTAALARTSGLAVRLGVARTRVARLDNRANPRERTNFLLGRAEVGLEAARVFRTFEGGAEVRDLLAEGRALELAELDSPFSESVGAVVAQVLAELGRLPGCDEAERLAGESTTRRRPGIFGRRREVR